MFLCPVVELGCVSDQDTGLSDLFRHCMQTPEEENHEKALVRLSHLLPALLCSIPSDKIYNYRKPLFISPGLMFRTAYEWRGIYPREL